MTKPRLVKGGGGQLPAATSPQARIIEFGAIGLGPNGSVVPTGEPDFSDYSNAMNFALYCEENGPFWVAALLEYGYQRPDWDGVIDGVIDAGRFTARTISQYRSVHKRVPPHERVEGLSFSHHEAVAALPTPDKRYYLEQAKREHLSVSALKQTIRSERTTTKILNGQASELAKAHADIVIAAREAQDACREIPHQDAAHAEQKISEARNALDAAEEAVATLRKAQGRK